MPCYWQRISFRFIQCSLKFIPIHHLLLLISTTWSLVVQVLLRLPALPQSHESIRSGKQVFNSSQGPLVPCNVIISHKNKVSDLTVPFFLLPLGSFLQSWYVLFKPVSPIVIGQQLCLLPPFSLR